MRMTRLGCAVDVANDGLEAVRLANANAYDLILMDCQMPLMDGFQATRAIREGQGSGRRVPIVALTANAMEGERERCLEAGMDDYLAKPVRPDDLIGKLQPWLGLEPAPPPATPVVAHKLREQFETFVGDMKEQEIPREDIDFMLLKYLEITTQSLERLAESIERQEQQPASFAAHSLKGSSATIGLGDLAHALASVEDAVKKQCWQKAVDDMVPVTGLFEAARELIAAAIHPQAGPV
jgi:CheY-like chemotaxis protein